MAYVLVTSACIGCGRLISYNPMRVPSTIVEGKREPLCPQCADRINQNRIRDGLPPIPPHPDAYEPMDESEVDWG